MLFLLLVWGPFGAAQAQDLEPRRWTHLPVGLNVAGFGGGWTEGEIFLDPVLLIEDATFEMAVMGAAYARAFDFKGRTARLDVTVPYGSGRWEGLVDGEPDGEASSVS